MEMDISSRPENLERWLSVDEIATHLGVSKVSIHKWVEAGRIPAYKVGRQWKFRVADVDAWVVNGGAATKRLNQGENNSV